MIHDFVILYQCQILMLYLIKLKGVNCNASETGSAPSPHPLPFPYNCDDRKSGNGSRNGLCFELNGDRVPLK